MHPRETIQEKFSTRLYQGMWKTDQELLTNIQQLIGVYGDQSENFWLDYFCRSCENNTDPLAEKHILAFLEEPCKKVANSIKQNTLIALNLSKEDCFQLARDVAKNKWYRIFKKYDSSKGKLKTWMHNKLYFALIDELRKNGEFRNRSDWGLLKGSSKKAMKDALKQGGIQESSFANYLLVFQGFKQICAAITVQKPQRELPPPTPEQWQTITYYFNSLVAPPHGKKTVAEIQELLQICVQILRAKEINPIQQEKNVNQEEESEDPKISPEMIALLGKAIAPLSKDAKKMLILYYGLSKFNQTKIGEIFGIPQYQVTRKLQRYRREIIITVLRQQRQNHRQITNEMIDEYSENLTQYLKPYFQTGIIYRFLQIALVHFNGKQEHLAQFLEDRLQSWLHQIVKVSPIGLQQTNKSSNLVVSKFLNYRLNHTI